MPLAVVRKTWLPCELIVLPLGGTGQRKAKADFRKVILHVRRENHIITVRNIGLGQESRIIIGQRRIGDSHRRDFRDDAIARKQKS